jgi:hypothetical protein
MRLKRRLRREHDACATPDVHRRRERIAAEDAGAGADQDRVGRTTEVEGAGHAERRLGIAVREHGAAAALLEGELEARVPSDRRGRAAIGRLKGSAIARLKGSRSVFRKDGEPFRRAAVVYDS